MNWARLNRKLPVLAARKMLDAGSDRLFDWAASALICAGPTKMLFASVELATPVEPEPTLTFEPAKVLFCTRLFAEGEFSFTPASTSQTTLWSTT